MRAHDIKFKMNSGARKGDEFGFTLSLIDGQKAWASTKLLQEAPSMVNERIDIVINALGGNIPLSGATEMQIVRRTLEQLDTISAETTFVTMTGLDGIDRSVLVDVVGAVLKPIIHEKDRDPEYQVSMTLWGYHKAKAS